MTRLAFVDRPESLDGRLEADLVVAGSYAAYLRAGALGRDCVLEHDLLSADDIAEIQRLVADHRTRWSERLFGASGRELLGFEGYALDEFVDYELTFPFVEIFSGLRVCRNLAERYGPASVWCDAGLPVHRHLIDVCFRARGVPVAGAVGAPSGRVRGARPTASAKRSFRWARQERRQVARAAPGRSSVYLSTEGPYSRALLDGCSRRAFFEHSPSRALKLHDCYFWATRSQWSAPRKLQALRERLRRAWELARAASYDVDDVDVAGALRPVLRWLFTGDVLDERPYRSALCMSGAAHLPGIAGAISSLESLFQRARVGLVALNQDSVQGGVVAARVARRLGIPSIVLQHGVTAEFFPLRADRMFLWGEHGVDFYRRNGTEPSRLTITGNPLRAPHRSVDASRPPARPRAFDGPHRHVVTYISQPYTGLNPMHPPHGPDCHLHWFLVEAERHSEDLFVVRPHVLEDEAAMWALVGARSLPNVRIDRRQPLHDQILGSRSIVLHNSTVGLEALQLGKRILMVNYTGTPDLVPYAKSPNCVCTYAPHEFAAALERELSLEIPFVGEPEDPCVRGIVARSGSAAVAACLEAIEGILDRPMRDAAGRARA